MGARSMPAIVAVILELVLLSQAESSKKSTVFRFTPVLQPVSGQARECRGEVCHSFLSPILSLMS